MLLICSTFATKWPIMSFWGVLGSNHVSFMSVRWCLFQLPTISCTPSLLLIMAIVRLGNFGVCLLAHAESEKKQCVVSCGAVGGVYDSWTFQVPSYRGGAVFACDSVVRSSWESGSYYLKSEFRGDALKLFEDFVNYWLSTCWEFYCWTAVEFFLPFHLDWWTCSSAVVRHAVWWLARE